MNLIKKFNNLDYYTKLTIIIIIIGILLRLYFTSIYHVSGDACWQLSNSKFIAENQKLPVFEQFGRDEPFWAPPLFHFLTGLVYIIFNNFGRNVADTAIKFISPILGSLTLIIFFLISKKLFNKKIALFATLFLTFIPLHIDYSIFSYVDGMVTFLTVLSVYLALKNKIIPTAVIAGLAILTKYNGMFILPVLLYIIYNNNRNKDLNRNIATFLIISLAIGSLWFIRNWIYLGNPIWPFLNNIFNGIQIKTFAEYSVGSINLLNIFDLGGLLTFYLGFFGVPDGGISALSFVQIPYLNLLFVVWFLGTLIFLIPLITGITKKLQHKKLLYIWITSYIVLILLYIVNGGWSVSRFMLPAIPAIALFWAHGMQKTKRLFTIIITLIILGFILTIFVKITLASNAWNFFNDDFEWVITNTEKDAIFLAEGQCVSYNIERQTVSPQVANIEKADYVFVNQNFRLDKQVILDDKLLSEIKDRSDIIYSNEDTKTEIYKINK